MRLYTSHLPDTLSFTSLTTLWQEKVFEFIGPLYANVLEPTTSKLNVLFMKFLLNFAAKRRNEI